MFPTQIKLRSGSTCLLSSHTFGLSSGFSNKSVILHLLWVVYIKLLGIALSRHKIITKFHELNFSSKLRHYFQNEVVLSYIERTFLSESVADNSFPLENSKQMCLNSVMTEFYLPLSTHSASEKQCPDYTTRKTLLSVVTMAGSMQGCYSSASLKALCMDYMSTWRLKCLEPK